MANSAPGLKVDIAREGRGFAVILRDGDEIVGRATTAGGLSISLNHGYITQRFGVPMEGVRLPDFAQTLRLAAAPLLGIRP